MAQTDGIKLEFFASGYCVAQDKIVDPINGKGPCKFYAVWAFIDVPNIGYILFDTGYSKAFFNATQSFPERIYRWATPVFLEENETAINTLKRKNINPSEIKYIIISHFHADHIGGLKDFPNATIICSKIAHDEVKNTSGFSAVRKGILHQLLPKLYDNRMLFIEEIADKKEVNHHGLEEFWLFGLQEFKLISLPGHAKGMLGFILKNEKQHLFYATDASWRYHTYEQKILPKKIIKLFIDSWEEYVSTLSKIKSYENNYNNAQILFSHCPKTLNYILDDF